MHPWFIRFVLCMRKTKTKLFAYQGNHQKLTNTTLRQCLRLGVMICALQSFIIVCSILLTLSIFSNHAFIRTRGWSKLVAQGHTCFCRSSANFVLLVQLFTLQITQFEFGLCSGASMALVLWRLQGNIKYHTVVILWAVHSPTQVTLQYHSSLHYWSQCT